MVAGRKTGKTERKVRRRETPQNKPGERVVTVLLQLQLHIYLTLAHESWYSVVFCLSSKPTAYSVIRLIFILIR